MTTNETTTDAGYVDLDGLRTYHVVRGAGTPLVYLHGAFGDARELDPVIDAYTGHFRVHQPERRGHGRTPDVEGPFGFPVFAADIVAYLEKAVGGPADLVGYSDGATTALHVALARPDLVRRLVLISGQYHQRGLIAGVLDQPGFADLMLQTPLPQAYGELSPDGIGHFRVIVEKTIEMALTGPNLETDQLAGVSARTLVVCADDDGVHLEHTVELYRGIPDSELAVVPGTSHLLALEKPDVLTDIVVRFLTTDPVPTIAPVRRAR